MNTNYTAVSFGVAFFDLWTESCLARTRFRLSKIPACAMELRDGAVSWSVDVIEGD